MLSKLNKIDRFIDKYSFLSNFYIDRQGYCVEVYYQSSKFTGNTASKVLQMSPGQAKRFAHIPKNIELIRKDWNDISLHNMVKFLRIKFMVEPERTMLIETGDCELIEGNNWHDNFYGACSCKECENIPKQNHLGKLLMKIREEIKLDK